MFRLHPSMILPVENLLGLAGHFGTGCTRLKRLVLVEQRNLSKRPERNGAEISSETSEMSAGQHSLSCVSSKNITMAVAHPHSLPSAACNLWGSASPKELFSLRMQWMQHPTAAAC